MQIYLFFFLIFVNDPLKYLFLQLQNFVVIFTSLFSFQLHSPSHFQVNLEPTVHKILVLEQYWIYIY